jgi:hypothetical protein
MNDNSQRPLGSSNLHSRSLVLGVALVLLGVFFLFGQLVGALFHVNLGRFFWPFYIIVPAFLLLLFGLFGKPGAGEPLSMLGGMATAVGILLFFQNLTGLWASWAYAWALVIVGGLGAGQMAYGLVKDEQDKVRSGQRMVMIGGLLFLAGAFFFELILGISGFGLGRWAWSFLLIGLGVVLLIRAFLPGLRDQE